MADLGTDRLAVLIDADNAQPSVAPELMNDIGRYGTATVRRAYEDGWAFLGAVGSFINKAIPEFDPRNYGQKNLGELVRTQNYLEIKTQGAKDGGPTALIYVRIKGSA